MTRIKQHTGAVPNLKTGGERRTTETNQKADITDEKKTSEEKPIDPVLLPIGDPAGAA